MIINVHTKNRECTEKSIHVNSCPRGKDPNQFFDFSTKKTLTSL